MSSRRIVATVHAVNARLPGPGSPATPRSLGRVLIVGREEETWFVCTSHVLEIIGIGLTEVGAL